MLLIRLILPLTLIAFTSCAATLIPVNPLEIAKESIATADKVLDLYNKILDQVIPWQEFNKTLIELDKYRDDYSNEAGQMVGEIKSLLLNGLDAYYMSTQSIYEWSGTTTYQLALYLKLFRSNSATAKEKQKQILLRVLENGIRKMNEAQQKLSDGFYVFNNATGKLSSLRSRLSNDFNEKSEYYEQKKSSIRTKAYVGAIGGIILGPFGLVISYSIAAGIVEGKLVPELNDKLDYISKFYDDLQQTVEKANVNISSTKQQLKNEIQIIGDLKVETENTQSTIDLDNIVEMREDVIASVTRLITHCNDYRERHGGKKKYE